MASGLLSYRKLQEMGTRSETRTRGTMVGGNTPIIYFTTSADPYNI